ncbi:preprotein translocase subunit SecG [Syntrophomonas palmitatica]|uniref:preprotein translocase subunit SecG n=1 Tax=Syntrophomonas palmitatica TaxID=402877 RepID=UPI00155DA928|nr:preprotein translocase subunit SecG [Syntrophomonas palmitatica]
MAKILLLVTQIIFAIALIVVIILQPGKSAGLSGSISGGSEAFFGSKSKGVDELLSKITGYIAAGFMIITLVLTLLK